MQSYLENMKAAKRKSQEKHHSGDFHEQKRNKPKSQCQHQRQRQCYCQRHTHTNMNITSELHDFPIFVKFALGSTTNVTTCSIELSSSTSDHCIKSVSSTSFDCLPSSIASSKYIQFRLLMHLRSRTRALYCVQ